MGNEISHRIALEEMDNISPYIELLDYLEIELRPENRGEDLSAWMKEYVQSTDNLPTLSEMDIYASIDGKIVAASYWENDAFFNPYVTEWYQKAIAAEGNTIYTDSYIDSRLQIPVVTIAKQISGTKDVIAIDLYFNDITIAEYTKTLPEGSNYFMCDKTGQILYSVLSESYSHNAVQDHVLNIFYQIKNSMLDSKISTIKGMDNEKRGVYYYEMENGWYSIVTIPYSTLLADYNKIWIPFFVILVPFFACIITYLILSFQDKKRLQIYDTTLAVLANSYYALYQIDLPTARYEMLKGSDFARSLIPPKGDYSLFLDVLTRILEPDTYAEFEQAFSIESMTHLAQNRVRDFGGDFKRWFNNESRWIHVQMLYDESFHSGKVVLCFRDVNDAKNNELARIELLQNSLNTLSHVAQSKARFFSNMSHDMRTPLNGIIGLSTLALQRVHDPEKTTDSLNKILSSSKQLLDLINDVLEISTLEQANFEIAETTFPLEEKLTELAEIFQIQATEQNKTFHFECTLFNKTVVGDWRRIQQVLNNILSNAFKYSPKNAEIRFIVHEFFDPNSKYSKYKFVVQDNGFGMTEEFLQKLFLPFERETRFGAAEISGTGLGMPITKDLVTQMEGQIEVESKPNVGTVVTVMLPLQIVNAEDVAQSVSPNSWIDETPTDYCILLAEDNQINMEIATEMLTMNHFKVEQAWNGKQAVEMFQNSPVGYYDAILMDMKMPIMNGCDASKAIRALKRTDAKTIPIIAVTANAFSEDISQTTQAGMNAHIAKPIDFSVLQSTLKKLLAQNHNAKTTV